MLGSLRLIVLALILLPSALFSQQAQNVLAWGDNAYGQSNVPPDLTNAISVAAANGFSMALTADGRIVEWGITNYNSRSVLSNVVFIAAGDNRYAVTSGGLCAVWGPDYTNTLFLENVVQV